MRVRVPSILSISSMCRWRIASMPGERFSGNQSTLVRKPES
jgi:hypothetical protein